MNRWLRLMRFDRPIGIFLLLWPTWWALWLAAGGRPSGRNFLIFTAGVVVMRAAGCAINDYADRDFDPHVARTRQRPLPAGEIAPRQALWLFAILLAAALALVSFTNRLTILLAFAGAVLAAAYPYFKRWTHWPQVVLGAAFGWSIPMAFAAETGAVPVAAWLLYAINMLWVLIYDTEYAMADREEDLLVGIKSTAILFGRHDRLIIGLLQVTMLLGLFGLGVMVPLDPLWYAVLPVVAGLFAWQQWLLRTRVAAQCFRAFLHNNWVGLAIFMLLVLALGAAG